MAVCKLAEDYETKLLGQKQHCMTAWSLVDCKWSDVTSLLSIVNHDHSHEYYCNFAASVLSGIRLQSLMCDPAQWLTQWLSTVNGAGRNSLEQVNTDLTCSMAIAWAYMKPHSTFILIQWLCCSEPLHIMIDQCKQWHCKWPGKCWSEAV